MLLNLTLFLFGAEGELIGNVGGKQIRAVEVSARGYQYVVVVGYIDYRADVKCGVGITIDLTGALVENFSSEG